jgi:hypothetical protein
MSPEAYGKSKAQGEMVAGNIYGEVKSAGIEADKN